MKKLIAILMVLVVLLSFAACKEKEETGGETTAAVELTPVQLIRLSLTDEVVGEKSIYAYVNEEGQIYVEYVGEEKKTGVLDASALAGITQQVEKANFASMNEENVYNEGPAAASFYIYYGEEDFIGGGYTGTSEDIPQAFIDGYGQMDSYFQTLLKDMQLYIPTDKIAENVDADVKSELMKIFAASGATLAEKLLVEDVLWDEDFYSNTGLTSDYGIVNATRCGNMRVPADYSFVIVTLEDSSFINAVASDFKANDGWFQQSEGPEYTSYVAYKGNLVLCVIGSGDLYDQTVSAIGQCDWTVFEG